MPSFLDRVAYPSGPLLVSSCVAEEQVSLRCALAHETHPSISASVARQSRLLPCSIWLRPLNSGRLAPLADIVFPPESRPSRARSGPGYNELGKGEPGPPDENAASKPDESRSWRSEPTLRKPSSLAAVRTRSAAEPPTLSAWACASAARTSSIEIEAAFCVAPLSADLSRTGGASHRVGLARHVSIGFGEEAQTANGGLGCVLRVGGTGGG